MAENLSSRGWPGRFAALFYLSLSALAVKEMHLSKPAMAVRDPLEAVTSSLIFPGQSVRLRENYTRIPKLDAVFRTLVAAFVPGAAGWDKSFQIQQVYFLLAFFPILAVMSVEACKKNASTLIRWTSIWALFYQTIGGAVALPLYFLVSLIESARKDYWSPVTLQLPTPYAKTLLPSLLIGYLLPTIAMYLPFSDPGLMLHQAIIALWQLSPIIVNILLVVLSTVYANTSAESKQAASPSADVKYVDRVYITSFVVSAIAHIGTVITCLYSSDPDVSFMKTLVRVPVSDPITMTEGLRHIFQVDFWIIFPAVVMSAFLTLWDLKRIGRMKMSLSRAAATMALSVLCVGPGATYAGVWYIRGHLMAEKKKR